MKSLQTEKPTISLGIITVAVPARMLPIIVKLANLKVSPTDKMPAPGNNAQKMTSHVTKSVWLEISPFDHTDYFFNFLLSDCQIFNWIRLKRKLMDLNEILTKERDVLRDENIELRNKIKELELKIQELQKNSR